MCGMRIETPTAELLQQAAHMPTTPGIGMTPEQIQTEIASGRLQPRWSQVALDDDGSIVGRALWWGRDEHKPIALDVWDAVPGHDMSEAILSALLEQGHAAVEVHGTPTPLPHTMRVPITWRDNTAVANDVHAKIATAATAGLSQHNERRQFQWDQGSPIQEPSPQLRFEQADDDTFINLIALVAHGSLDVMTRRQLTSTNALSLAREEVDYYLPVPATATGGASRTTNRTPSLASRSLRQHPRIATSATSRSCPSTADTDTSMTSWGSSPPSTPQPEHRGSPQPPTQ